MIVDTARFIGSVVYGTLAILLLLYSWRLGCDAYPNLAAYVWCLGTTLAGFAVIAYRSSRDRHDGKALRPM